ncbi:MAG: sigma-70 family RNA polymerase sigma factor [Actinobacteria bacterium]|nr:sigma-70 family RNA polymerase sigma factor [Actinomycetota bacterium]
MGDGPLGAEARFHRAYLEHYRAILAYALRRGVEYGAAEEIVAETFAVLWRRMGDAPDQDTLLPWLYGVAARVLANHRRAAARRERVSARLQALAPRSLEGESHALERLEVRAVIDALQQLSAGDQEVLLLAAWEGLSHGEIATALGCSENAAAIRLHRARKRLTALCRKEDTETHHKGEEGSSDHCGDNGGIR